MDNTHRKLFVIKQSKGAYLCLKYTKKRLAAELCPDPLLELMRCARPLAALLRATSEGREGMRRRGDEGVYLSINQSINQFYLLKMSRDTHKRLFNGEQDNKAETSTNSCPTNKRLAYEKK